MDLNFSRSMGESYTSASQKIRVLSEDWVVRNIYCPNCGNNKISAYDNNNPAADFNCRACFFDYELKSSQKPATNKIVDGAYSTMMKVIQNNTNPNLFFLNYKNFSVINFFVIPKYFFSADVIEKRTPLASTAKRAGWIGCNIIIKDIPAAGRIHLIKNEVITPQKEVLDTWKKTAFLREEKIQTRGWTLDVMKCIERLKKADFSLNEIYSFENILKEKHPENNHVRDKIRQQLQILRDRDYIKFLGNGKYELIV